MDWKKLPWLACGGVLALGVGYYALHVEPHQEDLIEVDFQRLATMAERVDLQVSTFERVVANAESSRELPKPLEHVGDWSRDQIRNREVTIRPALAEGHSWLVFDMDGAARARLRAGELAQRSLEPLSFDKLILATSDGEIVSAQGREDIELTHLSGLGIQTKSLRENLSKSTGILDAVVSGKSYKVFIRPCRMARVDKPPGRLILCGLLRSSTFHWRPFKMSANWVILLFGLLLLAMLSLPFVKLLTLGPGARLRAIDGLLAGLCAVISLSVLTVLAMDSFVFLKLTRAEDTQLRGLAQAIQIKLHEDLAAALNDLRRIDQAAVKSAGRTIVPIPESRSDFYWVDKNGQQILKWTPNGISDSLIQVGERDYFRDALDIEQRGQTWKGASEPSFAVESIQSWTSSKPMVVVAIPETGGTIKDRQRNVHVSAVAALSTRLPSVHDAVLPPGFGFAVMDATGRVIFHSNPLRMFQENFLEETKSQKLRALVLGERAGTETVDYMGLEHRVMAEPFPDLPWTVVAFRDLSVLRATNVQIITTALAFLIAYAILYLALFSVVYLASSTRARWLWPSTCRQESYLQLAFFYVGCLVVHAALLFHGKPVFLIANGMLVPLLVLFVSYLKIRAEEGRSDSKQKVAGAIVVGLFFCSAAAGILGLENRERWWALAALTAGGLFLFLRPVTRFFLRHRHAISLPLAYCASGALLLTVLTVIPAASFLKVASDMPVENLVKRGQLQFAQQLGRIARPKSVTGTPPPYIDQFFQTARFRDRTPSRLEYFPVEYHPDWLISFQEPIFPVYNEESQALARLSQDLPQGASPWEWRHETFEAEGSSKSQGKTRSVLCLYPKGSSQDGLPGLLTDFPSVGPKGRDWALIGGGCLGILVLAFGLVSLLAKNVLLLGTASPQWLHRDRVRLGASAGHVVYVSQRPERLRAGMRPEAAVLDFAGAAEKVESRRILNDPVFDGKRLVVLRRFDHRLTDRGFNAAKLELLEALLRDGDRRIVLLSSRDPFLCLVCGLLCGGDEDAARDEEERERWRRALAHFSIIDLDGRLEDAKELAAKRKAFEARLLASPDRRGLDRISRERHVKSSLQLLWEESSPSRRLQEIGMELLPDLCIDEMSLDEIRHEILERAERYYQGIWESLSEDQRLVVVQLAEEGLTNPKNLRPFQRLVARGIIRRSPRDPAPRLFNETFRQFVTVVAVREGVHEIESGREKGSLWAQLKPPLTAALIGGLIFFGLTQRETFNSTLTLVAAVAGGLPHFLQLIGYLGTSRLPVPPIR